MKNLMTLLILVVFGHLMVNAQEEMKVKDEMKVSTDTSMICSNCESNIVSAGGKYYFNTLSNTRSTLSNSGFILEQEAIEYQVRLYNLPKLFYYQQLGTLSNTNYVSVTGVGLKEDFRFPVFKTSAFILTPYVELGGGLFRMNIAKGVKSNSITSVLGSQTESHTLDNFVVTGDVGLDLGVRFKVNDKRSVSIMVNGGYLANFPTEWRLAGSLAFKEKINLGSPYAGATIRIDMNDCGSNCCK
jgi:hypothetical protein